jgi:hypothetical protein
LSADAPEKVRQVFAAHLVKRPKINESQRDQVENMITPFKNTITSGFVAFSLVAAFSTQAFAESNQGSNAKFLPAPLVSIPTHDAFFSQISQHCGQAYSGKVTVDNAAGGGFADKKLVMHVRRCNEQELQIPFHVGDDASRTWIIKKTGSGLSLKHDHRHEDGSMDKSTMYGGHTVDAGYDNAQSFPADQYSKELFAQLGIPQSIGNTWQMFIYPATDVKPALFTYRLIRQGREFRVDFDLTKSIAVPKALSFANIRTC